MGRHAEEGIQGQESRRSGKELKTRRSSHDLGPQDSTHTTKSKESKSRKNRKASIEAVPYVEPKDVEVRSTHSAERIGDRKRNPHLEHVRDTRVNDTLSELNSVVSNTQYSVPGYEKFKEESGPMDSQFQERVKGEKTGTLTQVGNADMAALMADIQTKIDALLMDTKRDENDDDILSAQIVEEVMDYRTYYCAIAKPSAIATAALVLNLKHNKERKMDLPGRKVDFGASFPPLLQREIPTRFLQ